MLDYVGQSTTANYTLLDGDGWVGLIMSETVSSSEDWRGKIGIDRSTLQPANSSNSGGSSEMARRDIIPLLVSSTKTPQWRISVISKNSDKSYVPSTMKGKKKKELMVDISKYRYLDRPCYQSPSTW